MINMVLALALADRENDAPDIQEILTRHGCLIKIRLGIHEIAGCSNQGLIILVVRGEKQEIADFISELQEHPGVKTSSMEIDFIDK